MGYTSVAYNSMVAKGDICCSNSVGSLPDPLLTPMASDVAPEDWHSAGPGDQGSVVAEEDQEDPTAFFGTPRILSLSSPGKAPVSEFSAHEESEAEHEVTWRHPLIDSVMVLHKVREPPFSCSRKRL